MRWCLLALVACGPTDDPYLDGSLDEVYSLAFDQMRVREYDSEWALEYLDSERGDLVVLRVTLGRAGGPWAESVTHDLAQWGHVGRADHLGPLPAITEGRLEIDQRGGGEDLATGRFDAVFEEVGDLKLSVHGAFEAPVELMDL